MDHLASCLALSLAVVFASCMVAYSAERPAVIAHRGASGYLPEHTLAAKAMAYAMGADYLEQDVVLTRDDCPIVLHDVQLDTVTDVADRFPSRARDDGRFYAIDFTLEEIKRLRVSERMDLRSRAPVFPSRFPAGKSDFRIPTLEEEIELVQGLNTSTGQNVGIYPEIKSPAWHRRQGKDISSIVLEVLRRYGYQGRDCRCYLQCFDAAELKRLRFELKTQLKLVQLIGENAWKETATDYEAIRTADGLREVAKYAEAIGPSISHVAADTAEPPGYAITPLVRDAHAAGLAVHPYTFRADALPGYAASFEQLLRIFCDEVGVDGVFSDFPDRTASCFRAADKPRQETDASRPGSPRSP
ncbi:MAG: glycerophosphodiester phosphodiesterase [Pirellulales bacterium]|nr:glycerophosphodiester phosphodiesterase [Pirellulales bacterium]